MDQFSGLNISNGILREYTGQASDIIIPGSVKGISSAVFKDYHALRSIMLSEGLEEIDSRCFEGCTGLKTVMFPASLSRIGKYAFAGCSSLVFFRLPADLNIIGSYAFKDCSSLTSIEMPEGVNEIGVGAFAGCSELKSIRIPGIHTSIKSAFGTHPFVGCDKLNIYTPSGSEAEKFGIDNGIPVTNIYAPEEDRKKKTEKKAVNPPVSSETKAAVSSKESKKEENTAKVSPKPKGKASFTFAPPDSTIAVAAEKYNADHKDNEAEKNQQIYDEAVSLYNNGTEGDMQKAIEMMQSIGSFSDAHHKAREFTKSLKRKQKEARKKAAENARLERRKADEQKKPVVQKEITKPQRSFSRKTVVIMLALVLAAAVGAAGIYYANTHIGSSGGSSQSDYTLTLEDYINSNETAKEQLIESVEDTDVIISVSKNTLIYTYDLSTSNSMTPEIAQSDELRESLGETLDSSDEQFTELCAGLEKDTGISGVSVEVLFKYGDDILLTRTYTSEGKQE